MRSTMLGSVLLATMIAGCGGYCVNDGSITTAYCERSPSPSSPTSPDEPEPEVRYVLEDVTLDFVLPDGTPVSDHDATGYASEVGAPPTFVVWGQNARGAVAVVVALDRDVDDLAVGTSVTNDTLVGRVLYANVSTQTDAGESESISADEIIVEVSRVGDAQHLHVQARYPDQPTRLDTRFTVSQR
jgi:hypothetical protein